MKRFFARHFQLLGVLFPLTPARSLGEREKRSQSHRKSTSEFSSAIPELNEMGQRLFPPPGGEGQGEGKRGTITCAHRSSQRAFTHCATP
jgi:hypothetical protein